MSIFQTTEDFRAMSTLLRNGTLVTNTNHAQFVTALLAFQNGNYVDRKYTADIQKYLVFWDITQNPITPTDFENVYKLTRDGTMTVPDEGRFKQRYERFAQALDAHEQDDYVHPSELDVVKDFVLFALDKDVQENPIVSGDFAEIHTLQQRGVDVADYINAYRDSGRFAPRYWRFRQSLRAHKQNKYVHPEELKAVKDYVLYTEVIENPITPTDFENVYKLTRDGTMTVPDEGRFKQRYERFAQALDAHEQDDYVHPSELDVVKDFVLFALDKDVQENPIVSGDFAEIHTLQQRGVDVADYINAYRDSGRFAPRYWRFRQSLRAHKQNKYVHPEELKAVKDYVLYTEVIENPITSSDFEQIYMLQHNMGYFEQRYKRFMESLLAPNTQFLHPLERQAVNAYLAFEQQNTITEKDFERIYTLIIHTEKPVHIGDECFILAINAYHKNKFIHNNHKEAVEAFVAKYKSARISPEIKTNGDSRGTPYRH